MFSNTAIIASLVKQSSIPLTRKTLGTIERAIDSSNFVLRIGNDRIPIQTESGNLQPGDIVSCIVQKDKVILEKIYGKRQEYYPQSSDSFTPEDTVNLKDLKISQNTWKPSVNSVIISGIQEQVPVGIYKFDNIPDALRFSGKDSSQIDNLPDIKGPVFLRVIVSVQGDTSALLLDSREAEKDIESWPQDMKSKALQSTDPLILKTIVQQRGYLSLDTLHQIDDILLKSNPQVPAARAGSTSAQLAANDQWLLTVFENQIPPVKLTAFFPVSTAAGLSGTLEEVSSVLNALPLSIQNIPVLENSAITPQNMVSIDKTELIPETATRLGFNLENSIADGIVPQGNLKAELLKILGLLDNAATTQQQIPAQDRSESELDQKTTAAFDELESKLLKIIETISDGPIPARGDTRLEPKQESTVLQMLKEIKQALEQLEKGTSSNNVLAIPPFKIPDKEILSDLLLLMSNNEKLSPEVLIKKFISTLPEFFSSGKQSINRSTQWLSTISGILKAGADLQSAQESSVPKTDITLYKVNAARELMRFAVSDFISELKTDMNVPIKTEITGKYSEQLKNEFTKPEPQLLLPQAEVNLSKLRFEIIKTVSSLTFDINAAGRLLQTAGYGSAAQLTGSLTDELLSNPMKAFSTIDNRISQINLLMESVGALSNKENSVPGAVEVANDKLGIIQNKIPEFSAAIPDRSLLIKEATDQLSRLIDDISTLSATFSKAIPQSVSGLSLKAADPEAIRFFEIHLSNLSNQLRHELKEISSEIEQLRTRIDSFSHSDLQKLNPVHSGGDVQKGADIKTPDQPITDDSAARQMIRQPLETLLNRLESLQLLSRPTSTLSGDQQILALPMKIGGEWTEVNVRFVKRRNREKKDSSNQHYSVSLNVSPSKLGGIEVRMEYEVKKSLRLSMTFENELTANWFSDHNDLFRKAVGELGLPITQFELHKRTFTKAATPVSQREKDGFDITV